ncbi:LOG family protein [uncultured Thiodictyon sp.]|uniref:LOG family protein n=1 Tax=uncultured Thiodictyon sp. TaxID=1846217 RepID=UPI0025F49745|nr:LOG family protein [uncultured Thiodictyon sp.]
MYATPQTDDGWITHVHGREGEALVVDAHFVLPHQFCEQVRGRESELVFAARSRLARLGINITPLGEPVLDGCACDLRLEVVAAIQAYGMAEHLERLAVAGMRVGRLVFCPQDTRLNSTEIHTLIRDNQIQVPVGFSLDTHGYLILRPQQQVFQFRTPLAYEEVHAVAYHADGKELLNRLQVRTQVANIELAPMDGLVTACSMFLHRHFVVLQNRDDALGVHLQATVLDPISTRGTNIYLEFINRSDQLIVNPTVAATVHPATRREPQRHYWHGGPQDQQSAAESEYRALIQVFDRLEAAPPLAADCHRLMAATSDPAALLRGGAPDLLCLRPDSPERPHTAEEAAAAGTTPQCDACPTPLDRLADDAGATLLLGYFPNLIEHAEICAAALRRKVASVCFRRTAFEHGVFLSDRDHGRLADYEGLGLKVYWCNEARGHVLRHVFRGLRGYFTEPDTVDRFRSALIFAIYGSVKPLSDQELGHTERLIEHLKGLFGNDIGILTGGGPGSMQQVTDIASRQGLLIGSSFIETMDQETNKSADFYQTFQARSRQSRQRWFEIASFHIFLIGGVGTLEEIGLTLTDMKLGVIEASPVVFLDSAAGGDFYWEGLKTQLTRMVRAGRAPAWLLDNILMTADPEEVPRFYKKTLRLG